MHVADLSKLVKMALILRNPKRKRALSPGSLSLPLGNTIQLRFSKSEEDRLSLVSMEDRERLTHEGQHEEQEEHYDSDCDEGDAVLTRGYPRNHHNLKKHGFRPVWTCDEGYPEDEIPADIKEWLNENGERRQFSFFLFSI